MEFGILEFVIGIIAVIIFLYKYLSRNYDYWEKRGIPGPKPSVPFGNFADVILRRQGVPEKLTELYNTYKSEPFIGYFVGSSPTLLAIDPDFIKSVLIKDFNVFAGRGIKINEKTEPLAAHLFNLDGPRWKALRHKLTPVFTTGKLKQMFYLMNECAENFERHLQQQVKKNDKIEMREEAARYTTDSIGSCAFGIDMQSLADEDSIFRKVGRQIFQSSFSMQLKRLLREISPRLYKSLRLSTLAPEITEFFVNTMKDTVAMRKKDNTSRNDFVDLMLQISKDSTTDGFEWNEQVLAAQAFVFFAAGFETSSTTISFALWELARTPDVQDKLRREILEFEKKNDGKLTYDIVNEMKYLDMVVKETLRKDSPAGALVRVSMQDYTIPGTKITLSSGQRILIPVRGLHMDPDIYPKPKIFDPERFSEEAKQNRHPMTFLPFGDGPKNCIGLRFANYQVKLALIKVIKNFRVIPTMRMDEEYIVDKASLVLAPVGGLYLKLEPIGERNN